MEYLTECYGWDIREDSSIGIKPISVPGPKRLVRAAIRYAMSIPVSLMLSGANMFRYLGRVEAADLIEAVIGDRIVTYDLARLMKYVSEVKTSRFATEMIARMPIIEEYAALHGTRRAPSHLRAYM